MKTAGNKMPFSQWRKTQRPMPIPLNFLRLPESHYVARGLVVYRISALVIMTHMSNEPVWCTNKDHYDVNTYFERAPIILPKGRDMLKH